MPEGPVDERLALHPAQREAQQARLRDAYTQKAALPLTGAEREKAYQAIAAYVAKNMNMIPICQPNFSFGLSDRLQWQSRMDGLFSISALSNASRACKSDMQD